MERNQPADLKHRGTWIEIINLGPLKKAEIEFSSISVLLGKPNTGKSYALRSIYGLLGILNESQSNAIEENLKNNLIPIVSVGDRTSNQELAGEILYGIVFQVFNLMNDPEYQQIPLIKRVLKNSKVRTFTKELIDVSRKVGPPKQIQLRIEISKKRFYESVTKAILKNLEKLIPKAKESLMKINGETIEEIVNRSPIITSISFKDHDVQISIPSGQLLYPLFEERNSSILRRFLPLTLMDVDFSVTGSFTIAPLDEERILIDLKLSVPDYHNIAQVPTSTSYNRYMFDILESLEPKDLIEAFSGLVTFIERQKNISEVVQQEVLEEISSQISKAVIEGIVKKISDLSVTEIKRSIGASSGLNNVRFIPYGRSLSALLFSTIRKGLITDPQRLNLIKELEGVPYYDYFKLLESGIGMIEEGNDLQDLFIPILGGHIKVRKVSGEIVFEYRRGKSVPIKFSSAMVEEVLGIMAPLMAIGENELVLVEEPEAQLHYSSQIVLALVLIAFSKLKKTQFIIATHSDIIALTFSTFSARNPSQQSIVRLIEVLNDKTRVPRHYIDKLATEVSSKKGTFQTKYYLLDSAGISKEVKKEDVDTSVPEITTVFSRFLNWKLNLDNYEQKLNERGIH